MKYYWEDKVSVVIEAKSDVVYKIKEEQNPKAKQQVMYRNLLKPCDVLLDNVDWELEELYQDR